MPKFSIGTSVITLVPHNPKRTSLGIVNTDTAAIIYVGKYGAMSSGGEGADMALLPRSGIAFSRKSGDDPTLALYGICDTASKSIYVYEGFGV